jgi:hypothetical protein
MDETDHHALENADKTSLLLLDELSSSRRERVTACMDETDHHAPENADKTSLLLLDELSSSRREVLSEHLRTRKALR